MSAQHTPGPWLIEAGVCHSGDIATVYNTTEKWVTIYAPNWIETGLDQHEQSANARLIAAAPELLEALIAMEAEKSDYMRRNNLGDPSVEHTNRQARAAIAKAKGGAA